MVQNKFGEMIFSEDDVVDMVMTGKDLAQINNMLVDNTVIFESARDILETVPDFIPYNPTAIETLSQEEYDSYNQSNWYMPVEYKNMDIAAWILERCNTEAELQRCGEELLLFQEKNLFDVLKYLKYLVDVMTQNQLIWGVGRGSSVASFILYKIGVHRVDSLYYDLDIKEFLK
jgi:DNA polymerase III alpha subunit